MDAPNRVFTVPGVQNFAINPRVNAVGAFGVLEGWGFKSGRFSWRSNRCECPSLPLKPAWKSIALGGFLLDFDGAANSFAFLPIKVTIGRSMDVAEPVWPKT